jgi:hypothetical protein
MLGGRERCGKWAMQKIKRKKKEEKMTHKRDRKEDGNDTDRQEKS